jgi:hypothetical protein
VQTDEARTGTPASGAGAPAASPTPAEDAALVVPLYHARWRHFVWAAILGGLGLLLVTSFGGFGRTLGLLFLALAVWPGIEFTRTLAHEAGSIGVSALGVALPPRVCSGRRAELPFAEVKYAYFLRRVLPWMTTGPLLVVETKRGTFAYPRDWFASESDQRRIAASINRRAIRRAA